MAIIFVSIKKRQRLFFWGIAAFSGLVVVALSLVVLFPELKDTPDIVVQEVYDAPDVKINFDVIDSPQVKSLEPFAAPSSEDESGTRKDNPFVR